MKFSKSTSCTRIPAVCFAIQILHGNPVLCRTYFWPIISYLDGKNIVCTLIDFKLFYRYLVVTQWSINIRVELFFSVLHLEWSDKIRHIPCYLYLISRDRNVNFIIHLFLLLLDVSRAGWFAADIELCHKGSCHWGVSNVDINYWHLSTVCSSGFLIISLENRFNIL